MFCGSWVSLGSSRELGYRERPTLWAYEGICHGGVFVDGACWEGQMPLLRTGLFSVEAGHMIRELGDCRTLSEASLVASWEGFRR